MFNSGRTLIENAMLTVILLSLLLAVPCPIPQASSVKVAVSIPSLALIASEVGGERVSVYTLLPEGAEPHSFQLTPRVLSRALEADIVMITGPGHCPFEDELYESLSGEVSFLTLEDYGRHGCQLREFPGVGLNIHGYWLDPENAVAVAEAFCERLCELDPEGEAYYRERLREFSERVLNLSSAKPLEGLRAIVSKPVEAYLCRALGVEVVGTLSTGSSQLGVGEMWRLYDEAGRDVDLIVVSDESERSRVGEFARQLSRDTGVPVLRLRILSGDFRGYTDMLEWNISHSDEFTAEPGAPARSLLVSLAVASASTAVSLAVSVRRGKFGGG